MRHTLRSAFVAAIVLIGVLVLGAVPAGAIPPVRERLENPVSFSLEDCGFEILFERVQDKEYITTYFDKDGNVIRQILTGVLKYNATNVDTGETVFLNISGMGTYTPQEDGSVHLLGTGNWLLFGIANRPGEVLITSGKFEGEFVPDGFVLTQPPNNESSLCEILG